MASHGGQFSMECSMSETKIFGTIFPGEPKFVSIYNTNSDATFNTSYCRRTYVLFSKTLQELTLQIVVCFFKVFIIYRLQNF
jgi:hypothetical protein